MPPKLLPLFEGEARYRACWGGRGSGKTRSFALMSAVRGYMFGREGRDGQILCAREHLNSLDESSMEEVKSAIRSVPWLEAYYDIGEKYIRSRDGNIRYVFAGLRHNVDSLKSKAKILIAWIDEAEGVPESSWRKLIPTVREPGSEIWPTWNPEAKNSATNLRFRLDPPTSYKGCALNYLDNPWFPIELEQERLDDELKRPHIYGHIWEGGYADAAEGAYFADHLIKADKEGRIGRVSADPLMRLRLFLDLGGTGNSADAFSCWVAQFVGQEVRVLDYYEQQGQPLAAHIEWMHSRGYAPAKADIWLPHDGSTNDRVFDVSFESAFRQAGYATAVIPNQGKGAAKARVEALRRIFPSIWFNEETTEAGRDALAWYHEKRDDKRNIGLGPEHDWSSHGADAAGLMAIVHSQHNPRSKPQPRPRQRSVWAA
jgi:phage terminase large subunit